MTLEELYASIGGDYSRALKVLRVEKLVNKHIQKLPGNPIFPALVAAGETMDATALFENAHAMKGISANLGLTRIMELSTELADEFRPESTRKLSDEEVREKVKEIDTLFQHTSAEIKNYAASLQ